MFVLHYTLNSIMNKLISLQKIYPMKVLQFINCRHISVQNRWASKIKIPSRAKVAIPHTHTHTQCDGMNGVLN